MGSPDFWNNQESAQEIVQQVKALKMWVEPFESLSLRAVSAQEYLRHKPLTIDPRKMQAVGGKIPAEQLLETGRALSFWGDGGWGGLVKEQRALGEFSDELVGAAARLVQTWKPDPRPRWVASVPSMRHPELVPSVATRIAAELGIPYHDVLRRRHDAPPQAEMQNSAQQHANVQGAFALTEPVPDTPVLLVDDTTDSRWTLTVVGGLLREGGSGPVLPLVLAQHSGD